MDPQQIENQHPACCSVCGKPEANCLCLVNPGDEIDPSGLPESADGAGSGKTERNGVTDPFVGKVVNGQYEILSLVARGGMGEVYRAKHLGLGSVRALKLIRSDSKNPSSAKRLEQEAKAVSRLQHPGIVTCHDYGTTVDGLSYVVMEFVDGRTLAEEFEASGIMSVDRILSIMIQVMEALQHAHETGIFHRDIKPSNIMLVDDGHERAKVLDFGIAKVGAADFTMQKLTSTGEIFGSPFYMSPEQAQGLTIDERADIYSLGCVMYEALTGKPPFVGENAIETIMKHLTQPAAPIPLLPQHGSTGKVIHSVEAFITRCLAKKPDERYKNVSAALEDLRKIAGGQQLVTLRFKQKFGNRLLKFYQLGIVAVVLLYLLFDSYVNVWGPYSWLNQLREANVLHYRPELAVVHFRDALSRVPQNDTAERNKASIYLDWGRVYLSHGRIDEAIDRFNKGLYHIEKYRDANTRKRSFDIHMIRTDILEGLAQSYLRKNEPGRAFEYAEKSLGDRLAMARSEKLMGQVNRQEAYLSVGTCYLLMAQSIIQRNGSLSREDLLKAKSYYDEAEKYLGHKHVNQVTLLADVLAAKVAVMLRIEPVDYRECLKILERALSLKVQVEGPDSSSVKVLRERIAAIKTKV